MKKLILLTVFVMAGCSSSEVIQSESVTQPDKAVDRSAEKLEPEIKREEKLSVSQYSPLDEAIKQQNDDAIQKASAQILTQSSKDLKALNALAMVYFKRGRLEAATYLLNKALAAYPDSSETHSNRGLVELAKGERREAVKSFRKAIEIDPKNAVAGANVGALYVQEKDYNKALLALDIAVKNGVRDYKTMNNYAISLTGTGKTKEAADIYEKILKENPSQKEVMLNYSILLIEEMQKYKEGLDLLNRLKFVGTGSDSRQVIKELEIKAKAGLQ